MLEPGHHVILRDHTGIQKVVQLGSVNQSRNNGNVRLGKLRIPMAFLLEHGDYGCTYRCDGGDLWHLVDEEQLFNERLSSHVSESNEAELSDSSELVQATEKNDESSSTPVGAQLLSAEEIHEMKSCGISPQAIIDRLIQNSSTFASKTKFSQAKYIKKKRAKHWKEFTLLPVSLMDIAETHAQGNFKRIGGLRFDYLSAMLTNANVRSGTRVFVLDQCAGLLTAGVLQRLAGCGVVYRASGAGLGDKVIREMNFSDKQIFPLQDVALSDLITFSEAKEDAETKPEAPPCSGDEENALETVAVDSFRENDTRGSLVVSSSRDAKKNLVDTIRCLAKNNVESFLIAVSPGCRPLEVSVDEVCDAVCSLALKLLLSDGRFVLFSLSHSHAVTVQQRLLQSGHFIGVRFEELLLREHIVLPSRTHPLMQPEYRMFCGFLVSAIRVQA